MGKGARFFAKKRKANLKKDNLMEDKVIKSLEKKLKLNKKSTKSLPKSFMADGLDCILFNYIYIFNHKFLTIKLIILFFVYLGNKDIQCRCYFIKIIIIHVENLCTYIPYPNFRSSGYM